MAEGETRSNSKRTEHEIMEQLLPSWAHRWLAWADKPLDRGEYELVGTTPGLPVQDPEKDRVPTELEVKTLRKVADHLPWSTFLIAIVELCERFTYYGLSGPFQNYISNSYQDPNGLPGAIGMDQSGATFLTNFFQFWCYLTPVLGAVIADQYLGKYWTIVYFAIIYAAGIFVLFATSLPIAIEHGAALPGLVLAMVIIGLGTGGIKSNVSPLIAEQYTSTASFVRTLGTGEQVIVDPAITIKRIYMIFYLCINIGSLSSLLTTNMEVHIGFWSSYLLCFVVFLVGLTVLLAGKKNYVLHPPTGSVIPRALGICWTASKKNFTLPTTSASLKDEAFIQEVRTALQACKVFLIFPLYWLAQSQMLNNLVSQAGQMQLHGIPNDIMSNIDPLTIILFIPICDRLLYPFLHNNLGIAFKPITRIFVGFMFGAAGMAYAAAVQKKIYNSGPCYEQPGACSAGLREDGKTYRPNEVHIAVQTPAFLFIGMSEIFAAVTGLEFAYTKAPASMKAFIMSIFLLTTAVGAALGALISPFAKDPDLFWVYAGLAAVCFVSGWIFWYCFRGMNDTEDEKRVVEHEP